jgi:NADH-quinone oxidoreductase subunit L
MPILAAAQTQGPLIPALLLMLPFAVALIILLGHRALKNASVLISVGSSVVCFLASISLLATEGADGTLQLFPFIDIAGMHAGIDVRIDPQSRGMMFIVTFIGMLVHIFSMGYMKDDDAKPRFFGSLSLFMFSMTGIVLSANLVMMFIFWELVGLSSYLLIGHWFQKPTAAEACKKAFLTNRIGDFGFMIGILLLFGLNHGDVDLDNLKDSLVEGGPLATVMKDSPWLHHGCGSLPFPRCCRQIGAVSAACLAAGRHGRPHARLRTHPRRHDGGRWCVHAGAHQLPDPASPLAAETIAGIGCFTALLAALMATQQNDIKRILAYSTLSQLGYMVMAVGAVAMMGPASRGRTARIPAIRPCSISTHTPSSKRCSSSAPARSSTPATTSRTSGRWAACASTCRSLSGPLPSARRHSWACHL